MPKIKERSLQEIADFIGGEIEGHENPKSFLISNLAISPETSTSDDLALVFDLKYFKQLLNIKAKAIILPKDAKGKLPQLPYPIIWATRPRLVLKKLLEFFSESMFMPSGIDSRAIIDPSSKIGTNCRVGANAFIGPDCLIGEGTIICPNGYIGKNVKIGQNCILYPNCTILDECQIGNNVILHSGVVIGSDGYGYVTEEESNLEKAKRGDFNFNFGRQVQHKIQSIGNVIIEDDVEIGANSCVDRGTIGPTVIGAGTKIDNLVQIAHNCKVGKDCLIVGQVGFAGSVSVGDRVVAGGQSGFADNINIGNDAIFVARAAVHGNIPSNTVYMGFPAVPYQDYFKNERAMKRLPRKTEKLEEQIKALEEKVKELEEKLDTSLRGSGTTEAISRT
jgi:UDP-3-O-[3-hydroxymyristoyl] glucosamine N-acyltransferase